MGFFHPGDLGLGFWIVVILIVAIVPFLIIGITTYLLAKAVKRNKEEISKKSGD